MTATDNRSRGKRILEWFWRGHALARVRAAAGDVAAERRALVCRAKVAFDLARRTLAPETDAAGAAGVAAELFRQAAYWALLALSADRTRVSPQALWAAADRTVLLEAAGGPDDLAAIQVLFNLGFVDLADQPPAAQRTAVVQLERFATGMLAASRKPLIELEEVKIQRFFGVSLLIVGVLAIAVLLTAGVRRITRQPNLAAGKSWTASSEYAKCHPEERQCVGAVTDIFFHTNADDNPWFEYDFGAPMRFSSLTVGNRRDYGPERAVPLIAEVSNDRKTYTEIARRTEVFDTWHPKFAPQRARYLRLRVARVSWLHLEAVEVHP